jgi:hypothetical protein
MVKLDVPNLSDSELARLLAALQCEDAVRRDRRAQAATKEFAAKLVKIDPFSPKYRWHVAPWYISSTILKRFQGGFFVRPRATNAEMYAKTKTGVLYYFSERNRMWEKK